MEPRAEDDDPVRIELRGISLYTHHGVTDAEQEVGQRLEIDVGLELTDCEALQSDDLAGTVDYAAVGELVERVATGARYRTLERLAAVIGERLVASFDVSAATVRAAKLEPPMPLELSSAGVTVTTRRDA